MRLWTLLAMICLYLICAASAKAEELSLRPTGYVADEECQQRMQASWLRQKQGDIDARYSFYYGVLRKWFYLDGRSRDQMMRSRDFLVYNFHSAGAAEMAAELQRITPQEQWITIASYNPAFDRMENSELKKCILENGYNQECTKIAVERKLIPSFEEYAKEIDMYLAGGAKFQCLSYQKK